jgi:hypothetical protein
MIVGMPWPRFHTSCCGSLLPAGTTGFFFLRDITYLSPLRRAGKSWRVEIALGEANSSYLSMMLRQVLLFTTQGTQ